jgi:hypothetical protein
MEMDGWFIYALLNDAVISLTIASDDGMINE